MPEELFFNPAMLEQALQCISGRAGMSSHALNRVIQLAHSASDFDYIGFSVQVGNFHVYIASSDGINRVFSAGVPLCAKVSRTGFPLGVRDVHADGELSSHPIVKDYSYVRGYLGIPVFINNTRPIAVVSGTTFDRPIQHLKRNQSVLSLAARSLEDIIRGWDVPYGESQINHDAGHHACSV